MFNNPFRLKLVLSLRFELLCLCHIIILLYRPPPPPHLVPFVGFVFVKASVVFGNMLLKIINSRISILSQTIVRLMDCFNTNPCSYISAQMCVVMHIHALTFLKKMMFLWYTSLHLNFCWMVWRHTIHMPWHTFLKNVVSLYISLLLNFYGLVWLHTLSLPFIFLLNGV